MKNLILNEGYPKSKIFFEAAKGSKIISRGKKFLDLGFGAGSLLLGHNSKIYRYAIKNILKRNISNLVAPNKQAKDFSKIIKKVLPQYSKFIFCNSGTEANFKSLRICSALNKKKIIIGVSGSWHGSVNQLLFSTDKKLKPIALSQGLSKNDERNIKFIPYNNIETSKKILGKYKKNINCIIIEPIQGCLPLESSKKYLKFLYSFCRKNKILLIFDEMITALRIDGKSVQSYFKIKPDICTFGKCLGGGMPIGIIAISKKFENLIKKKKKKIFFGGTYSGNSISSYVGMKTTEYILKNKNKIFSDLDRKAIFFQKSLNKFIKQNNIDASIYRFKSMLRIVFTRKKVANRIQRDSFEEKNLKKIIKLRNFLLKNKIFYPSNGIIYVSTSTTLTDLKIIIKLFKKGLINLNRSFI